MPGLSRFIGEVAEKNGMKILLAQGRELELAGDTVAITAGGTYRIVGTLEDNLLHAELARRLEGFDLKLYERALGASTA